MSFIKPDDIWLLWAVILGLAAFSLFAEQKSKFAAKLTGPVIGLILAITASNLKIIPMESTVYDSVYIYFLPVAVALLLFKSDARKIFRETGQSLITFHIGALGTCIGVVVATLIFKGIDSKIIQLAPVMTGSYIGGTVNFFAMIDVFKPDPSVIGAAIVADNVVLSLFFMMTLYIPGTKFFRKHYKHPHEIEVENSVQISEDKTMQSEYWKAKEISLLDIALAISSAFILSAASVKIAGFISNNTTGAIQIFFGNTFIILTTVVLIFATTFPNFFGKLKGTEEIGTFLIYTFFIVAGVPANLSDLITKAPLAFIFIAIIGIINVATLLGFGKLFKLNIEEICIAIGATLGGPTTAVAMSIARGWKKLIVPGLLVGLWGYIIGNYLGIVIGKLFGF